MALRCLHFPECSSCPLIAGELYSTFLKGGYMGEYIVELGVIKEDTRSLDPES